MKQFQKELKPLRYKFVHLCYYFVTRYTTNLCNYVGCTGFEPVTPTLSR